MVTIKIGKEKKKKKIRERPNKISKRRKEEKG